jgi:anti-sigma factor ChrR (cupin superfamily)
MLVNPDFSRHAVVRAGEQPWVASPQAGVQRLMLDRLGGEHARATSLVRYAPRSTFPTHAHPGGEEILVLAGTFSDDSGDHGPGCYLRNPPGSAHRPASAEGALIFVKLWQMSASDTRTVRLDTNDPAAWRPEAVREGDREICPLYANGQETVSLLRLPPGHPFAPDTRGGAELLVLDGQLTQAGATFDRLSWLRLPAGAADAFAAGAEGVALYLKTGHLAATAA